MKWKESYQWFKLLFGLIALGVMIYQAHLLNKIYEVIRN